jgi:hypothetical protein
MLAKSGRGEGRQLSGFDSRQKFPKKSLGFQISHLDAREELIFDEFVLPPGEGAKAPMVRDIPDKHGNEVMALDLMTEIKFKPESNVFTQHLFIESVHQHAAVVCEQKEMTVVFFLKYLVEIALCHACDPRLPVATLGEG